MKKINKITKILSVSFIAATSMYAGQASAELYISPALTETITIDERANETLTNNENGNVVVGKSQDHGRFVMQEKPVTKTKAYASGSNVPLFFAIEANTPKDQGWVIHIEEGIQKKPMSWKDDSGTWEGTLKAIAKQNNLFVTIDPVEKAIGVSSSEELSVILANKVPQVWNVAPGSTVKKTLEQWSKKAGWNMHWSDQVTVDFPIAYGATFTGKFVGEGGVVYQLLDSMRNTDSPLRAEFYTKNKVLVIKEAGFQQEVKY